MMAYFSLTGSNLPFYIENMGRYLVPSAIIFFYYGERRGKLCLNVDNKCNTISSVQDKK